jgi:hypothetical protein
MGQAGGDDREIWVVACLSPARVFAREFRRSGRVMAAVVGCEHATDCWGSANSKKETPERTTTPPVEPATTTLPSIACTTYRDKPSI